ncbi:MAG TPA: Rrf2 family transcriptional regulator [Elusimicrobia bacterium]|jgi:Rrf2 family protein|nr:Rrf2 family transcriptional regulator [Elusimicrobiota bacterium]
MMKISTKGEYGLRAMVDLTLRYGDGPVLLKDIAQRQNVSKKYLDHLVSDLRTAGLVRSIRGAKGGYLLSRPPKEIKLLEIIQILEGSISPCECLDNLNICQNAKSCVTREIWKKVKNAITGVLDSTNLEDLVKGKKYKKF